MNSQTRRDFLKASVTASTALAAGPRAWTACSYAAAAESIDPVAGIRLAYHISRNTHANRAGMGSFPRQPPCLHHHQHSRVK